MVINDLKTLLDSIIPQKNKIAYKRISKDCIPDLNIGINELGQVSLILELSKAHNQSIKTISTQNLYLVDDVKLNCIYISLIDDYFTELFLDLSLSIYNKLKNKINEAEAIKAFLSTYYKWIILFEKTNIRTFSFEELLGIYGELKHLDIYLKNNSNDINYYLKSWKGPIGKSKDFEFEFKDQEIKTKLLKSNSISISSEYQLSRVIDKKLELIVYQVELNNRGETICFLINSIKEQIYTNNADINLFYYSLSRIGINNHDLDEFTKDFFTLKSCLVYDCNNQFPSISIDNTSQAIFDIKYKIRLSLINDFLINKIEFDGN